MFQRHVLFFSLGEKAMNISERADGAKAVAKKGEELAKKMMVRVHFKVLYILLSFRVTTPAKSTKIRVVKTQIMVKFRA